jgi:hypothetical protein
MIGELGNEGLALLPANMEALTFVPVPIPFVRRPDCVVLLVSHRSHSRRTALNLRSSDRFLDSNAGTDDL